MEKKKKKFYGGRASLVSKPFGREAEDYISIPLANTDLDWEGIYSLYT